MKNKKTIIIIVLIIIVLALIGYIIFDKNGSTNTSIENTNSSVNTEVNNNSETNTVTKSEEPNEPMDDEDENTEVIANINPYVVTGDILSYMTPEDLVNFQVAMEGIFAQERYVKCSNSHDANLRVMGAIQDSIYSFFLEDITLVNNNTTFMFDYKFPFDEQAAMRSYIDGEFMNLINGSITNDMTTLSKVIGLYSAIQSTVKYDYSYEAGISHRMIVYDALQSRLATDYAYTRMLEFALEQIGVTTVKLDGETVGGDFHEWLAVKLNGSMYHLDLTYDALCSNVPTLEFFGMTDYERNNTGIYNWDISYDKSFGEIECNQNTFKDFRDKNYFERDNNDCNILHLYSNGNVTTFSLK